VLFYLTGGRSAQEIAEELVISLATVRSHIRSILRKLGVRSQLAAVAMANRRGHNLTEPAHFA
jgi:DNA-binding CsgD family transcriptional regulator